LAELERRHWPLAATLWIAAVMSGGFLTFVVALQLVEMLVLHASFPVWRPSLTMAALAGPIVWIAMLAVQELLWLVGWRRSPRERRKH
jgi:hypothetical protein